MSTVEYLKVLSDTNTLRIINLLSKKRLCVCELEALTDLKQSNLSRHLSKLSKAKVISRSKESQWVYYSISESFLAGNGLLFEYLKSQFNAEPVFINDTEQLEHFEANNIDCSHITRNISILPRA